MNSKRLTSKECREAFAQSGFTYADLCEADIHALQGYIAIECARSSLAGETPLFTIPRRKADSLVAKFEDGGVGLTKAFLRIEYPGFWNGREAISFNEDTFIGFVGWADDRNAQPFYRAFMRWLDEWLTIETSDTATLEHFTPQDTKRFFSTGN